MSCLLTGCRVLVTRPAGQQSELIEAIKTQGGHPLGLPLLTIEPATDAIWDAIWDTHAKHGTSVAEQLGTPTEKPRNTQAEARLGECLSRLDEYDLLIFVSVNAARFGAQLIADYDAEISSSARLLAVGAATARAAASLLERPVEGPTAGGGSERLLELPQLEDVKGRRVAIFRGEGGRELLAEELSRRGAIPDYLEVYRRTPTVDAAERLRGILAQSKPDIAVITSAEALVRWCEIVREIGGSVPQQPVGVPQKSFATDAVAKSAKKHPTALPLQANEGAGRNAHRLLEMPVAVPSRRVAELAAKHGVATVVNAGDAGAKAMIAALAAYWRRSKP